MLKKWEGLVRNEVLNNLLLTSMTEKNVIILSFIILFWSYHLHKLLFSSRNIFLKYSVYALWTFKLISTVLANTCNKWLHTHTHTHTNTHTHAHTQSLGITRSADRSRHDQKTNSFLLVNILNTRNTQHSLKLSECNNKDTTWVRREKKSLPSGQPSCSPCGVQPARAEAKGRSHTGKMPGRHSLTTLYLGQPPNTRYQRTPLPLITGKSNQVWQARTEWSFGGIA